MDWDQYAEAYPQLDDTATVPPLLHRAMAGSSGTALDVGCGDGGLLSLLRAAYGGDWDLVGFEVSPVRADTTRRRGHRVVVDETPAAVLEAGSFDLVMSTHVIEHVPDDRDYAVQLREMAKPGGMVYVETPVKLSGAWYFRRNPQAGWVLDPTHVREYRSAAAVNEVLTSAGLEVVADDLTQVAFPLAAAEVLARRLLRMPPAPPTARLTGLRAKEVPIPRYRQQAVLARRPSCDAHVRR